MEVVDFTTQDGRGNLQPLRRVLARAVTESKANVAKNAWLTAVLGEVVTIVTADGLLNYSDLTSDTTSNSTAPHILHMLIKAASESATYGGDYKTQLLADLGDCVTELAA